jgi:hypothetical protein
MPSTYEKIDTTTLVSAVASVTLSTIPATYTDLVLVINGGFSAGDQLNLQFNSDTTSNYSWTYLRGDGSSATSSRGSSQTEIILGNLTTGIDSINITQIQNYANTTTFKTVLNRSNFASGRVQATVGLWRKSPEAITAIKVFKNGAGTFNVGSTFTLYGIKAA